MVKIFRKISIFSKISKNFHNVKFSKIFRFWLKFSKIFDLSENFEKFRSWSKLSEKLRKFPNVSILVKFSKNFDFGQNFWKFRKIFIFVKFSKKISIFVKIIDNFADFGQNFRKNFENFEKFRLRSNVRKIWISSKIPKNFDFGQKNFDFGQNYRKFFWSNFSKKIRFIRQNFEKFRFGSNFRKFSEKSILVKFTILVKFSISILVKIFETLGFLRKFSIFNRKLSIRVKLSNNFDFGQNFRKISILVDIFENFGQILKKKFFGQIFDNFENVDFSKIFEKFFGQNFS